MVRTGKAVVQHLGAMGAAAISTIATAAPPSADLAAETLGLERCTVLAPVIAQNEDGTSVAAFPINGGPAVLILTPHTNQDGDYDLLVQGPNGELVSVPPGPVTTVRGEVIGAERGVAAGAILDDGLHLRIRLESGAEHWIEPLAARVADSGGMYASYRGEDVLANPGTCATDAAAAAAFEEQLARDDAPPALAGGSGLCMAQIACDADFEYFQDYGSVAAVESRINAVINAMNVQYEQEVGITHLITTVIVRSNSSDPYSATGASAMLSQFRNHWQANHAAIPRDVAHLFTGKNIDGSTIGIATLGAVCGSSAYGVVQSDFSGNLSCVTDLSAHELGHNWGAGHCSCSGFTMNPSISCANTFHPTETVPDIVNFRDSRWCLDCGEFCGDGSCDPDEDPCNCPNDCGTPPATESLCANGLDDDCDGLVDCDDFDCGCPQLAGEAAGHQYGRALANVGDVDGDGFDELVVGAPFCDDGGAAAGKVFVVSGASLRSGGSVTLLYTFTGAAAGDRFGWSVARAGDLDADGFADFIVGAPLNDQNGSNAGQVYAYSGFDGSLLYRRRGKRAGDQFGYAVSGRADVDNDGHDDFFVGAPRNDDAANDAGKAYVYSGRTGSRLQTLAGQAANDRFGSSVAGLGRINGGGDEDFAVGAPFHDAAGSNAGRVYVFAGRSSQLLYTLDGRRAGDRFGWSVARIGRVDDDNRIDFVIGAPWYDRSGADDAGRIAVYSGKTGSPLWSRTETAAGARLGWSVAGAGDANCDGTPDVIAGAPRLDDGGQNAGGAAVRSGLDGTLIASVSGGTVGNQLGRAVTGGLRDPGDPCRDDALAGAPFDDTAASDAGAVRLIEF